MAYVADKIAPEEVTFIKHILLANEYPETFIDRCINKFVTSKLQPENSQPVFGPEKKQIVITLPFCGLNSLKLRRQLKRMVCAVIPWANLRMISKPTVKLGCLSKLKDSISRLSMSHLVYKINCMDCSEFYIGMTCRRLEDRLSEHSSSENSALYRHFSETGHKIDFDSPEILAKDTFRTRLLIKETLKIQEYHASRSLNRNTGSYELRLW